MSNHQSFEAARGLELSLAKIPADFKNQQDTARAAYHCYMDEFRSEEIFRRHTSRAPVSPASFRR